MKRTTMMMMLLGLMVGALTVGCGDADQDESVDGKANETLFGVKLEGGQSSVKFDSEKSLKSLQVAAKRVQIPHVKRSTGRMWNSFEYYPAIAIYIVDRSPETREWTVGSGGTSRSNQGIWAESSDSVSFSTGITISAMIKEEDAAKFLYRYPATGGGMTEPIEGIRRTIPYRSELKSVMDREVRGKVQAVFSDFSAGYNMSDLRGKKLQIVEEIRKVVIPFFAERGITVTNVGLAGGFTYGNPDIQSAIDKVFVAQRQKGVNKAMLDAQEDENKRIELKATALAEAKRKNSKAVADAILMEKTAEADGQRLLLAVAKEAAANPVFIRLRELDVEMVKAGRWKGDVPHTVFGGSGGGGAPPILMTLPLAPAHK
jgi:hypothetical protein